MKNKKFFTLKCYKIDYFSAVVKTERYKTIIMRFITSLGQPKFMDESGLHYTLLQNSRFLRYSGNCTVKLRGYSIHR